MGRVCVGRLCYGPSLQWAEFAMGRDVQLPSSALPNGQMEMIETPVLDSKHMSYTVTSIVQSNVELKVGCNQEIELLSYSGYNLTN